MNIRAFIEREYRAWKPRKRNQGVPLYYQNLVLCLNPTNYSLPPSLASLWYKEIGPETACAFAETLHTNTALAKLM